MSIKSIWLAAVLSSCGVQHRVTISTKALSKGLVELDNNGVAHVVVEHHQDEKRPVFEKYNLRLEQSLVLHEGQISIRDLLESCGAHNRRDCILNNWQNEKFILREWKSYRAPSLGDTIFGIALIGPLVGGVAFGVSGEGTTKERFKRGGKVALGSYGVLLVGGLVLAVISCTGRWGSPGCRD